MNKITQRRKELGKCYNCGNPAVPGKVRCQIHIDQRKNQRTLWKNSGLCPLCGKELAPERKMCSHHLELARNRQNRIYKDRVTNSVCAGCGKAKPINGHLHCRKCAKKNADRQIVHSWGDVRGVILKRDSYKCRICGNNRRKSLIVHHKDDQGNHNSNHPNNNLDNLITLCKNCHAALTKLRNYNTNLAIELLSVPRYSP